MHSTSLSDRERRIRQKLKDDFAHYGPKCLRVRTKAGAIVPFTPNRSQLYLHGRLESQRERTGKVRALVLKGRQVGISTYIGGRFYWRVSHSRGVRAFILTHLDAASDNLFEMAKRFHDNCPDLVRPQTGKANAKELTFSVLQSGYKVATAGSAEVGRSETIQLFHGSEVAFWPYAEKHAAGIQQAIADAPGTEDIRESTANGIGNAFHQAWKAAERGDSEFEAIFIPWYWHEEYTKEPPADWKTPDAWRDYGEAYDLTPGQIYWAYLKNRDLCVLAGSDPSEPCWMFRQEYPGNADEAFQTSGDKAFITPEHVLKARKSKHDAWGPIILGVDPARGGGDKTGLIDRQGRVMGAHCCKRLDNNDLMATAGQIIHEVRRLYPLGLQKVVIDTTGLGAGLYDRLREQLGQLILGVNFGSRAHDPVHFADRRTEIWDGLRQWFRDPAGCQIPDSDDLQGDLCAPVWGKGATQFTSNGALRLESKDHMRERLNFSPDLGDAAALTFSVDTTVLADLDSFEEDRMDQRSHSSTGY